MLTLPSLLELLQAGVHFGHQSSRWHPKMRPYIFTERGGIHVIDLEKTREKLETALAFVRDVATRGGTILFVGTKRQAQDAIKREAERCGMPYIQNRWLGGTLTNFPELRRLIRRLKTLQEQQEKGELKKYTKMEQLWFTREIEDLNRKVGGIRNMERRPDSVFLVDLKHEKTALAEATVTKLPVVGLCDTNVNPEDVAYPIPANDDATKGIELLVRLMAEAVLEGKGEWEKRAATGQQAAPVSKTIGLAAKPVETETPASDAEKETAS